MVTLLSATNPGKWTRRCDARCHNATTPHCACLCGGHYHGKREGSPALEQAVEDWQHELLYALGVREQAGELRILFARESLRERPLISRRGTRRPAQVALLPDIPPPP